MFDTLNPMADAAREAYERYALARAARKLLGNTAQLDAAIYKAGAEWENASRALTRTELAAVIVSVEEDVAVLFESRGE